MPSGLNVLDNVACRAMLDNGEEFTIFSADSGSIDGSLQMTTKTVKFDTETPIISDIKYFTDSSLTEEVPNNYWYNKPVTAMVVCSDTPTDEAVSCACAQAVHSSTTDASLWSVGVPNNIVGADVMRYTRTLSGNLAGTTKVTITDSA